MDPAHRLGGLDNRGFRPEPVLGVRADLTPNRDELVAYEERVAPIHELKITGVRSGDDGLTKEHRLGHGQPESLRAMQGDVTVTGLDQAVQLATGKDLIENDRPSSTCSRTKPRGLFGMHPQVSRLDHQCRLVIGRKARRKAEIKPRGFFRSATLPASKMNRKSV